MTGPQAPDFSFSDLVAGHVTGYDPERRLVDLRTSGGTAVRVRLGGVTAAEFLRNLGEPYVDAVRPSRRPAHPGHPAVRLRGDLPGGRPRPAATPRGWCCSAAGAGEYNFEDPDWWAPQLGEIAGFYLRAQFGAGPIDYHNYRTMIKLAGEKNATTTARKPTPSRAWSTAWPRPTC